MAESAAGGGLCFDRLGMRKPKSRLTLRLSKGEGATVPLLLALLALTACADMTGPPPAPKECPRDLAYLTPQLVTPYPKLEAFIGKDALAATLHKPIDDSIVHGGGPERSIQMTEIQIKEYQNILANQDQVRAEDQKAGMSDDWIATYFSSVQDGITINQAFIDATKCRQAKAAEQTESVPAS
jgi:hypothetical protein